MCRTATLTRWEGYVLADGQNEFSRYALVLKADRLKMPKRSDLKRKKEQITLLRDRPMTEVS